MSNQDQTVPPAVIENLYPPLSGVSNDPTKNAVDGLNYKLNAKGCIGGLDPVFKQHVGVYGESDQQGVLGHSTSNNGTGVFGNSAGNGFGVRGETKDGIAINGKSYGNGIAGRFEGDVEVTGDIKLVNADVAEDFTMADYKSVAPGFVMTLKEDGTLTACTKDYDKKVAGVISGAGDYKPALILDKQSYCKERMPIALMGKVFCLVDADFGAIEAGDMLTTSSTVGHAMKADDPYKAFGSVIGKALGPLSYGKGLIPVLVNLQ